MLGQVQVRTSDTGKYYLYSIHDMTGRCMFAGVDNLGAAVSMTKVRGNPVVNAREVYTVRLHQVFDRSLDAFNALSPILRELSPTTSPPWQHTTHLNRYIGVRCDQTGELYRNASQACQALNIPQARMSMHLARKAGHRTIKGMTFSYVNHHDRDASLLRAGLGLDGLPLPTPQPATTPPMPPRP